MALASCLNVRDMHARCTAARMVRWNVGISGGPGHDLREILQFGSYVRYLIYRGRSGFVAVLLHSARMIRTRSDRCHHVHTSSARPATEVELPIELLLLHH